MEALVRVRTAYPFHRPEADRTTRWACLLACGHTVERELASGERPRHVACPRCQPAPPLPVTDEFCIDFGD